MPVVIEAYRQFIAPATANATAASAELVAERNNREYLIIVNNSDTDVWLGVGNDAVVGSGVVVKSAGGSYELSVGNGNLTKEAVNAIHAGIGNKALGIQEATMNGS